MRTPAQIAGDRKNAAQLTKHWGDKPPCYVCGSEHSTAHKNTEYKGQWLCREHLMGEEHEPVERSQTGCALAGIDNDGIEKDPDFSWQKWLRKHSKKHPKTRFNLMDLQDEY